MAKYQKSISYKNCTIDLGDMTLTEVLKDEINEFSILNVLKQWDGISGIDISFRKSNEITSEQEAVSEDGE